MVYCGQLNKMWVEKLQMAGVDAVGLSGLDGRIFEGTRKDTLRVRIDGKRLVLRDDWTGTVERVNTRLLHTLLDAGFFPVLTPPGASDKGEAINVDGDRAAAASGARRRRGVRHRPRGRRSPARGPRSSGHPPPCRSHFR